MHLTCGTSDGDREGWGRFVRRNWCCRTLKLSQLPLINQWIYWHNGEAEEDPLMYIKTVS